MALIGINQPSAEPQKESGLDKVLKGIQIAQGLMGTALAIPKFMQERKEFQSLAAQRQANVDETRAKLAPVSAEQKSWFKEQGVPEAAMPQNVGQAQDLAGKLIETPAQKEARARADATLELAKGTYLRMSEKDKRDIEKEEFERKNKEKESFNERYVPNIGLAYTAQDAKDIKEAFEAKKGLESNIDEMIKLRKQMGGGAILDRAAVERGKGLSNTVLLKLKTLEKLGQLTEADQAIVNAVIPKDPLAYKWSGTGEDPIISNLSKFKQDKINEFNEKLNMRIKEPIKEINGVKYKKVQGGWEAVD